MYLVGVRRGGNLRHGSDQTWGKDMQVGKAAYQLVWLGGKWRYLSLAVQQEFGIWSDTPGEFREQP